MPLGKQAERNLLNFPLESMLLEWGLEREAAPPPSQEAPKVPKAQKAKARVPEDALWESLYKQHWSPELR